MWGGKDTFLFLKKIFIFCRAGSLLLGELFLIAVRGDCSLGAVGRLLTEAASPAVEQRLSGFSSWEHGISYLCGLRDLP